MIFFCAVVVAKDIKFLIFSSAFFLLYILYFVVVVVLTDKERPDINYKKSGGKTLWVLIEKKRNPYVHGKNRK